jgi:MFS family permease
MDPAAFAPPAADPNGLVNTDAACRKCSYNVRGLSVTDRCPECGTPVGISIHGDLLRYSDPDWVEKLARGVNLILWGIVAAIVAGIAGTVLAFNFDLWLGQAIAFVGGLVGLVGAWLLTEPDPGTQEPPQTVTSRRIVRFALLVGLAQNLLMFAGNRANHPIVERAFGMAAIIAGIVGVIGLFAQIYYLEILARRIPDEALARRANNVRWGFGISYGIMVVGGSLLGFLSAFMQRGQQSGPGPAFFFFGCITAIAAVVALVYAIIYLIMLFRFNRVLRIQADFARHTWAAVINTPQSITPPPIARQS